LGPETRRWISFAVPSRSRRNLPEPLWLAAVELPDNTLCILAIRQKTREKSMAAETFWG